MGLFSILGKIVKPLVSIAATATPIGSVGSVASGIVSSFGGGTAQRVNVPTVRTRLPAGSRIQVPRGGIIGAVQRALPGGASGFTTIPGTLLPPAPRGPGGIIGLLPGVPGGVSGFAENGGGGGVCPPRGMHLNKSNYFLRDGTFVPKGSRFVTNRKRNRSNGRANDNAIRRLDGAEEQAKKVLRKTGWRTISKQSGREIRNSKKATCK